MRSYSIFVLFLSFLGILTACKSKAPVEKSRNQAMVSSPRVIIYQTNDDYFMHVPVELSEDKKSLVSYPAPGDVFYKGDLAYPVRLEGNFLLDRRGIGPQTAFLKWTYYEYSRLSKTPSQEEILKMMLDKSPIKVMYDCGRQSSFKNLEQELNTKILSGDFSGFKQLK